MTPAERAEALASDARADEEEAFCEALKAEVAAGVPILCEELENEAIEAEGDYKEEATEETATEWDKALSRLECAYILRQAVARSVTCLTNTLTPSEALGIVKEELVLYYTTIGQEGFDSQTRFDSLKKALKVVAKDRASIEVPE